MTLFFGVFIGLILSEFVKGLSANGTPPVLQKFSWQMDLAYFMWSHILKIRIVFSLALLVLAINLDVENPLLFGFGLILCFAFWGGIYWLFNKFWIGRYKFLPIGQKVFLSPDASNIDVSLDIIGVEINGEKKAYPANLLFYHHVVSDTVGGKPILASYCGMCRSGRVYDIDWPEGSPEFMLVGAVSFNAVLRDNITQTWWRQETGEAVKGARKGDQLDDIYFEQMSLENWIEKHPDTTILQYDPDFAGKYNFFAKLLKFEADLPRWHLQETPPLVIGVELDGVERAYDLIELYNLKLVNDEIGPHAVLAVSDPGKTSAFIYSRNVDGQTLTFEMRNDVMIDQQTQSTWDHLGRCIKGDLLGKNLAQIQSYKQFIRAWITFHPETSFYKFKG